MRFMENLKHIMCTMIYIRYVFNSDFSSLLLCKNMMSIDKCSICKKGYAQGHLRGSGGLWMRKWIKLFAHLIAMTGSDMRQRAAICSTAHRHPKSCNLTG